MFRKHFAAGLVSLAMLGAAAPANAGEVSVRIGITQPGHVYVPGATYVDHRGHDYRRALSLREIRRILRGEGFRHIDFVDTEGRSYTAYAENYRGRPVIVRVSARSGEVISVSPLRRGRHDDHPRCWLPEGCH